jgi:hypothetical protein
MVPKLFSEEAWAAVAAVDNARVPGCNLPGIIARLLFLLSLKSVGSADAPLYPLHITL